jgi:hypothetical protein
LLQQILWNPYGFREDRFQKIYQIDNWLVIEVLLFCLTSGFGTKTRNQKNKTKQMTIGREIDLQGKKDGERFVVVVVVVVVAPDTLGCSACIAGGDNGGDNSGPTELHIRLPVAIQEL